ncbi:MAG TPA: hypothetical protein VD886_00360, partial [Herpetosiphonaceae bacterium]|nr:hypothetical protein [Herpetosiphonaceae bacterium]
LAAQLGCEFANAGPALERVVVDMMGQTTVAGVYAAGDAVTPMQQAMQAAASGVLAGAALNRALIQEDFHRG